MTDEEHFIMESKMISNYFTNIKDYKPSKIKKPLTIQSLLERIYHLEKQIEKMKCCQNCKHHYKAEDNDTYCHKCKKDEISSEISLWELKE